MSRSDRSPMRMKGHYIHPDLGDDPLPDSFALADQAMVKKIGAFLLEHYAGHPFRADVSHERGYIKVYLPEVMGSVNGFVIHISAVKNHVDFIRWMNRACGEILERYKLPRHRFNRDDWRAAIAKAPIIGLQKAAVPE